MTRIAIEPADAASLDVLVALHAGSFEEPWDRRSLGQFLAMPGSLALIAAALDGPRAGPVGVALCRTAEDECELLALGVVPENRRTGTARTLLHECVRRLAAMGAVKMFLDVAEDNVAARRLYDSFGFLEVGRRFGYAARENGEAATALTLRLDLDASSSETEF